MKQSIKNTKSDSKIKDLILIIIVIILIVELQINLLANLIIISNFDSPYLFEIVYGLLIKLIVGE